MDKLYLLITVNISRREIAEELRAQRSRVIEILKEIIPAFSASLRTQREKFSSK